MGILSSIFAKKKNTQQGVGTDPNVRTIHNASSNPPTPATNPQPSLAIQKCTEIEAEISRSHKD